MTKTALLIALAVCWIRLVLSYFVDLESGESTYIYRHAGLQGLGMRNWQVAQGPRDSLLLSSPEVQKKQTWNWTQWLIKNRREHEGRRKHVEGLQGEQEVDMISIHCMYM